MSAGGGDRFAALYATHCEFVGRVARAHGVEHGSIDDVVHEVFLVARARLDNLDPTRSARAWLAGIARNVVLHHHRSTGRRLRRLAALVPPESVPLPDECVARRQAAAAIQRFVTELTAEKREVFVLMEIEKMTARDVEAIVGVDHRTLHSRLRAARLEFAAFVRRLGDRDRLTTARTCRTPPGP